MTDKALKWPADKVERWPLADLIPYARNARRHSAEQVDQIVASIREFGWTIPILAAEDGTIIAGHGRVMAAERMGLSEVPVMVARGWTEEQRRAYTLADNKLAENADWDEELLRFELNELGDLGFEVNLIGFNPDELAKLLTDVGEAPAAEDGKLSLSDRFGIAPFSVLNAREGWWQDRKRAWLALGIQSEIGRGENLLKMSDTMLEPDPVKRAAKKAAAA